MKKSSYNADLQRILSQEKRLILGGDFEAEALIAVSEAKEYLWLIAGSKVRVPDKNRVY